MTEQVSRIRLDTLLMGSAEARRDALGGAADCRVRPPWPSTLRGCGRPDARRRRGPPGHATYASGHPQDVSLRCTVDALKQPARLVSRAQPNARVPTRVPLSSEPVATAALCRHTRAATL
eukprot:319495-Prymnesium_polylepis.1